ncbi:MAG: hypothetical protein KA447_14910, partial [Pyrinomonadaceae bacterium]|nr:hypothetical protein [Pyrinomonadaceae bacterium]
EAAGEIYGDNTGFVNIPLAGKEVLASVYMREVGADRYRVSLRSKGDVNVARVAEMFGGGGHKNAAGLRAEGDWDEIERVIVEAVRRAVEYSESDFDPTINGHPVAGVV